MAAMITTPRLMYVGGGALEETGACCAKLDLERVLIVTDPVMVEIGKLEQLTARLDDAGVDYDVFSDTVPEPTDGVVEVGAAMIQNGAFDGLIALGGGSPIDTAKAMNILAAGGGAMRDYKVPHQADLGVLPLIAIPTTAGTGS
ncbi:MAG: iron-containing alcohol dehydrogenase, partial [Alphaproteobacteria bacterium]|nr:iron-containing alcohol dehydrogenase [Alphaproteobacteria bacterium]